MTRRNRWYVGETPSHEPARKLDSLEAHVVEVRALKRQMLRLFGTPPPGCGLHVCPNNHDFGTYYTLEAEYPLDPHPEWEHDRVGIEWAAKMEAGLPMYWDEQALKELGYEREAGHEGEAQELDEDRPAGSGTDREERD